MSQGGNNTVEVMSSPNGARRQCAEQHHHHRVHSYDGPTYNYTLTLILDDYGSETTWTLKRLGQTLYEGGPYQTAPMGSDTEEFCPEKCAINSAADSYRTAFAAISGKELDPDHPNGDVVGTGGAFGAAANPVLP